MTIRPELTPFVVRALSGGRFPLALGVLHVLALDIGTDILPALALGMEASGQQALQRPPEDRRLLDFPLLVRAFGLLGPVGAIVEKTAFLASMAAFGWRPGWRFHKVMFSSPLPERLSPRWCSGKWPMPLSVAAQRAGWTANRFLVCAVAAELAVILAVSVHKVIKKPAEQRPDNFRVVQVQGLIPNG